MPGNLSAAAPSGVLPQTLCTAFTETRQYAMLANQYHDGETERGLITDGVNPAASIRTWKLSKSLTASQAATLLAFFEAQQGGLTPFYFYNPFEPESGSAIGSNYDSTGDSTQGRHTCVFRGDWTHTVDIALTAASLQLEEVA